MTPIRGASHLQLFNILAAVEVAKGCLGPCLNLRVSYLRTKGDSLLLNTGHWRLRLRLNLLLITSDLLDLLSRLLVGVGLLFIDHIGIVKAR